MPTTTSRTWGGLIIARPDPSLADDLQTITAAGFTVLSIRQVAGSTYVYVYGEEPAVTTWTNDFELKFRLQGWFIRLEAGQEITDYLVRQWVDRGQVAF